MVPVDGRRVSVQLHAVPADVEKGYAKDEELFDALAKTKVKGTRSFGFTRTATVPDSIKGDKVKWTTTVTAIGEKGIEKKVEGEGYGQEPTGNRPQAQAGPVIAGVLAAPALGGVWLVGRAGRKVQRQRRHAGARYECGATRGAPHRRDRMTRAVLALGLLALAAVPAAADICVPPPKGKKFVQVEHALVLGKGVTDYVFVLQTSLLLAPMEREFARVEFAEGKASPVPTPPKTLVTLHAVPAATAKEYKTDEQLFAALEKKKVKGAHRYEFLWQETLPESVKGDTVKWTTTITGIDAKRGFVTKVEGDGAPAKGAKGKGPQAQAAPVVAGVLAALALALGGAWLASRNRRKV